MQHVSDLMSDDSSIPLCLILFCIIMKVPLEICRYNDSYDEWATFLY